MQATQRLSVSRADGARAHATSVWSGHTYLTVHRLAGPLPLRYRRPGAASGPRRRHRNRVLGWFLHKRCEGGRTGLTVRGW